jgi:diacylglycerol kinase family enzyme
MPPSSTLERLADTFALDAPTDRKRMLVIVNPYASTVSDRLKNLVVYALQGRYEVDAIDTKGKNDATALAREAALEGYDVVVAFGGDGTVNEAANGLLGSDTPLSCLPGGGTNVYARLLGIPNDIIDATEHLLRVADDFVPRKVDVVKVNDRVFTFCAGLGLDASVTERVDSHPRLKHRFGAYYFMLAGLTIFTSRYVARPPRMRVTLPDGRSVDGVTTLVQNADPYSYFKKIPLHMAEGASLDSATVSGIVLKRSTPTVMPGVIYRMLSPSARLARHRAIEDFSGVDGLVVTSTDGRPIALQVDGDHIADVTEARFQVLPGALTVVA